MSTLFTSDPHLGHRNIANYRNFVSSSKENTDLYVADWKRNVTKRDTVYMLGDVAFDTESLDILSWLPGTKILIKGNHDDYVSTHLQANVFKEIHGIISYKGFWLSHCPIHPAEMRKRKGNVHGHTHSVHIETRNWYGKKIIDKRYLNVCVDTVWPKTGSMFVSLDNVRQYFSS